MIDAISYVAQATLYFSLAGLIGGLLFLPLVWPDGFKSRHLLVFLRTSWASALGATVVLLLLRGSYLTDKSWGAVVDGDLLRVVMTTWEGGVALFRLALLIIVGTFVFVGVQKRVDGWFTGSFIALSTVALAFSVGLAGSAAGEDPVPLIVSTTYVFASSVWLGATAVMSLVVTQRKSHEFLVAASAFGKVALIAVAVIVITGGYSALNRADSWNLFAEGEYGSFVMFQAFAVVALLGLGSRLYRQTPKSSHLLDEERIRSLFALQIASVGLVLAFAFAVTTAFDQNSSSMDGRDGANPQATVLV